MPHGPTKYPSKGVCIYCNRCEVQLTDEHVVPFSIGGQHILREASCLQCADITKKFEQDVARSLWGDARASYNAPTRRKKEQKKRILLQDPAAKNADLDVVIGDYPAPMVFYQMHRAGILDGEPENIDRSRVWKLISVVDENRLQDFERKYPGRLTARFKHVPDSFARLLVKIGYGQVMTSLDPGDFNAFCLPYILGLKTNLSYIVGGRITIEQPQPGIGYSLKSHQFGTADRIVLVSEVRLYANNHTPTYHIVVGDVVGRKNVGIVKKKLEAACSVDMPEQYDLPREPPEEFHWMPRVWPLPFWTP
jgi:hypothetical protein